jgi:hypothetical protein
MTDTTDDEPYEEPRLMTRIDGEAARLLVHIEPIEDVESPAAEACRPAQGAPPDGSDRPNRVP